MSPTRYVGRESVEDLVLLDQRVVERLEQVGVAVEPEVVADVDHVPLDVAGLHLGLDRGVRGVLGLLELHPGQGRVRHEPALALRLLVDATERRERERRALVLRGSRADVGGRGRCRAGRRRGTGRRAGAGRRRALPLPPPPLEHAATTRTMTIPSATGLKPRNMAPSSGRSGDPQAEALSRRIGPAAMIDAPTGRRTGPSSGRARCGPLGRGRRGGIVEGGEIGRLQGAPVGRSR